MERTDLLQSLDLGYFEVNCIRPEKTLCDKLSRLIRISFAKNSTEELVKHIRDIYDVQCIMSHPDISEKVFTEEFENGLLLTFEQDRLQHKYPHVNEDFRKASIFFEPQKILSEPTVVDSYKQLDKLLFDKNNNTLPELKQAIETLEGFQELISNVQYLKSHFGFSISR